MMLAAVCLVGLTGLTACSKKAAATSYGQNSIIGKVTAVSGDQITLALATMNMPSQSGGQGSASGSGKGQMGTPPSGQGSASGSGQTGTPPSGQGSASGSGQTGTPPSGQGSASGSGQSDMPSNGGQGGMTANLKLTGKSKTITVTDTTVIEKFSAQFGGGPGGSNGTSSSASTASSSGTSSSSSASLSDIQTGTILQVTYQANSTVIQSITIMGSADTGSTSGSSSAKS